jgi:hypothetical protein
MRTSLPIQKNITIAIGADFGLSIGFKQNNSNVDISGWSFWAEVWSGGVKIDDFDILKYDEKVEIVLPHERTIDYSPTKKAEWSLRFENDEGLRKDLFVGSASIVAYPTLPTPETSEEP